jgi:hypothetical protein
LSTRKERSLMSKEDVIERDKTSLSGIFITERIRDGQLSMLIKIRQNSRKVTSTKTSVCMLENGSLLYLV